MRLSEVKSALMKVDRVDFQLENGSYVPAHFHVTEVGEINKKFIDCGGVIRNEQVVNFQLWNADDEDHRLKPSKLLRIIELSEEQLGIGDFEVEVEYQADTIGKYELAFNGQDFLLVNKKTACLAEDACGIPVEKQKRNLADLKVNQSACCPPNSGCC